MRDPGRWSCRRPKTSAFPRRFTDRVEDLAGWFLATLALVGLLTAIVAGMRVHDGTLQRAQAEAETRTPVTAVLLENALMRAPSEGAEGTTLPVAVPVRWVGRDGVERIAPARVQPPRAAGETVTVWTDQRDRVVPPPISQEEAITAALFTGVMVSLGFGVVVFGAWYAVGRWALARNCAEWEREWRQVEPVWSGRARGGSVS